MGAAVVGLTLAQPLATVAAPAVLAALIIEGSSTNQSGADIENFFEGKFQQGDPPVFVNFLTGPFGIWRALAASRLEGDDDNTVMSSGWGAANASLLISYMKAADPDNPALTDTTWVLDNNVANPNGGFGTRYPVFALIGVNPIPTPADPGAVVISTAYEYDINGNAPQYVTNPFSMANSLAAYFDRRLTQADLPMPVDADGKILAPDGETELHCEVTCYETYADANGNPVKVRITQVDGVTYVGYEKDELPLLSPLRNYGGQGGDQIADAVEPALEALVNYGYPDNDPLANPGNLERARLIPTAKETRQFVENFADGVKDGIETLADEDDAERLAPRRQSSDRPLLNVLRGTQKFAPGERAAGKLSQRAPKLEPISVKGAVERLSIAFSPKHAAAHKNAGDTPQAAPEN